MKKSIITILLLLVLSISTHAEVSNINVVIDGKQVTYSEDLGYHFLDDANRTQMPLRTCLETYGADVTWDQETQTVIAVKNGTEVRIPLDKLFIQKNGVTIEIDSASTFIDGRAYLPIRAVMEAFNCSVNWDNDTKSIIIVQEEVEVVQEDYVAELVVAEVEVITPTETSPSPDFPLNYDSRKVRGSTPVKNQKNTGACWAFATTSVLESFLVEEQEYDFSEDNIIHNNEVTVRYATGGNTHTVFGYLSSWKGPVLESDDVFLDHKSNPDAEAVKHVQEIEFIDTDTNSMKQAITDFGSTQFNFYFDFNSREYNEDTSSYYYDGVDEEYTNHIVALVGWDDEYPKENFGTQPDNNGAFIAKNSWGKSFGDDGYFYISYEDYFVGHEEMSATIFSRVDDIDNYDHIYQYDLAGNNGSIGYDSSKAWFSNVFDKQSKNEVLRAVSFYTEGKESNVKVYYVDDFDTVADFERMQYIRRRHIDNAGYHTIDFNSIELSETGKFAVIIEMETPNSNYPIAAEFPDDTAENVEARLFQSFMSPDGSYWSDTALHYDNSNVCLKAFTDEIEE